MEGNGFEEEGNHIAAKRTLHNGEAVGKYANDDYAAFSRSGSGPRLKQEYREHTSEQDGGQRDCVL